MRRLHARGVTLLELVVTIVIIGIVAATTGIFIVPAMQAYQAQRQRAALVDAAESALRRIARDIRGAVPNSIRVSSVGTTFFALELIPAADGGRYCVAGEANCSARPEGANALLDVSAATASFVILGCFRNAAFVANPNAGADYRLVVGNSTDTDIYGAVGANRVITPAAGTAVTVAVSPEPAAACGSASATPGITNVHRVQIAPAYDFLSDSALQRVFVVEKAAAAVTYICDTATGTLTRYAGYGIQAVQPVTPGAGPLLPALERRVTENVSACGATNTALIQGAGMVTLDLSVTLDNETVRLVHQVQLDNSE